MSLRKTNPELARTAKQPEQPKKAPAAAEQPEHSSQAITAAQPPEQPKQAPAAAKQPEKAKEGTATMKQPEQTEDPTPAEKQPEQAMQATTAPKQPEQTIKAAAASKQPKQAAAAPKQPEIEQAHLFERFHGMERIAHALLLATFTLLAITGLPQKFALTGWAQAMIAFFGGIDTTREIHHVAAVVLILLAIYHLLDVGYKIFVRRTSLSMLPTLKDVKDALQVFLYNLGFGKIRPQMGRYTFEEKAEYWALIWGVVIMAITGAMMWNPIFTTKLLPGEIIPAAKAAHGGEALLAVMAIVVWHMYGVHIKRFNKAMWTGKQTEAEMLHEHPLELADIKAGLAERNVDAKTLRKHRTVYIPIASVLAVIMLLGLYGFVNGEKTAITTVLPISAPVAVYVPETPTPMPTPLPTATAAAGSSGALTWDATIGPLFKTKCSMCHGEALATKGLSFATFADAIKGAQDGPVIIPGNVEGSKLISIQSVNNHPGQLNADELAAVKNWIAAGAPEK